MPEHNEAVANQQKSYEDLKALQTKQAKYTLGKPIDQQNPVQPKTAAPASNATT